MMNKVQDIIFLLFAFFIYATTSLFTKYASLQPVLSFSYLIGIAGAVGVLGAYAIIWQQIIKRMDVSMAYMFKGTSLIFVMILAALFFGETITWMNILGAVVIIIGIILYAKA